ncbi:hypothetical protein HX773_24790 [Pantoea sp. B9002]|uniref:hypothetical protein n=1 Tax=Pantoea sp. B9002 TaxID=2726979 RepID=UPI0015A34587|nr:hypothetical protein [Pantoea sp. B9002]NWA64118.1 hypothetical protein [Pantoea sp. B9002]
MKRTFIALAVTVAAFNAAASVDFSGGEVVSYSHSTNVYSVKLHGATWSGVRSEQLTAQQLKGQAMKEALANSVNGVALEEANRTRTRQQVVAGGVAEVNAEMQAQQLTKAAAYNINPTSYRLGVMRLEQVQMGAAPTATINVAASSLKPSTPISVTVNGVTKTVAASTLAPSTQVAVPHIPAFERNPGKGSSNDQGASHSVGGGGNGDNNAANTNSAHGLGGGAHIGGGSAMGGGFHGQW